MTIKKKDIRKLAHLARLGVDKQELAGYATDINRIVEWVSILQAAPTDGLKPLTNPHEMATPLRTDEITESSDQYDLFQNAAQHQDNFFLVPQVI